MKLGVEEVGNSLYPSEVVVSVRTIEGTERLVVDRRAVDDGSLDVGYPISEDDDTFLVELPRETATGSWRVRVSRDFVIAKNSLEDARA